MAVTATNAVATQEVFSHSHLDGEVEIWDVPAGTPARTLVRNEGYVGVTLTNAPGITGTWEQDFGPYKVTGPLTVGVANEDAVAVGAHATGVTKNGTWEFDNIDGADEDTAQGDLVFLTPAGDLTVEASGNSEIGFVNYPGTYLKVAGTLPVKIGV